jgi:hypothetical protein
MKMTMRKKLTRTKTKRVRNGNAAIKSTRAKKFDVATVISIRRVTESQPHPKVPNPSKRKPRTTNTKRVPNGNAAIKSTRAKKLDVATVISIRRVTL